MASSDSQRSGFMYTVCVQGRGNRGRGWGVIAPSQILAEKEVQPRPWITRAMMLYTIPFEMSTYFSFITVLSRHEFFNEWLLDGCFNSFLHWWLAFLRKFVCTYWGSNWFITVDSTVQCSIETRNVLMSWKKGSTYNIVALVPPPDFQALLRALCILKATQKAPDFLACQIQTACYRFKPKSFDVIFRCRATVF